MKVLLILSLLMAVISADHYAFLVCGCNGWENYPGQAGVCHAYQVLIEKGFSPDNIILMSYNDNAYDPKNPFPGQLFNQPSKGPGIDVNKGCMVDYEKDSVNVDNFLKILAGEKTTGGNGKTLQTGPDDNLFIYFIDHGGPGSISFPKKDLYADQLIKAIEKMGEKKMFGQLTFYMEACNSGSMFVDLNTTGVYAVSAAKPNESSDMTYCDNAVVDGEIMDVCLGSLFSNGWEDDCDAEDINKESLQEQYKIVAKKCLPDQHPMQWGDKSFTSEKVSQFIGGTKRSNYLRRMNKIQNPKSESRVATHNLKLNYLTQKYAKNPTPSNFAELQNEISLINYFEEKFAQIQQQFQLTGESLLDSTTDYDCYRSVIGRFQDQCGKINENGKRHFKYFYELCQSKIDIENTFIQIDRICLNQQ